MLIFAGIIAAVASTGTSSNKTSPAPAASTPPPAASQHSSPPATPSQSAAPTPAARPITYTGAGSTVLKINKSTEPRAVTITHTGSSNFAVTNLDSSGSQIDLLVNTIGNYSGTRLIDAVQGQQTAAFQIEADGHWSLTLKPLSAVPAWDGSGTWTGHGDNLVAIQQGSFSGLDSVKMTNTGQSNFVVTAYNDTSNLLVNEIGNYSGTQLMPSGTVLLEIQSDGTWTLHKT